MFTWRLHYLFWCVSSHCIPRNSKLLQYCVYLSYIDQSTQKVTQIVKIMSTLLLQTCVQQESLYFKRCAHLLAKNRGSQKHILCGDWDIRPFDSNSKFSRDVPSCAFNSLYKFLNAFSVSRTRISPSSGVYGELVEDGPGFSRNSVSNVTS